MPEFEFNRTMNPSTEGMAVAIWRALFPRIKETEAKMTGEYVAVVEDRSTLRYDDRYLGRWRTGALHVTGISAAVDALRMVQTILEPVAEGKDALPMSALYPVLRSAIESASLAIYLLAPDDRDERLRRSYLIAADDAKYKSMFASTMGTANAAEVREQIQDEIRDLIGTRPSLGDPAAFRFVGVSYGDMVEKAEQAIAVDPVIEQRQRMPLLGMWQLLSGLSHAKQWSFISSMERSEAIVDADNQTAHVKMTSSAATIAVVLERAVEALEVALRLYGRRSNDHWAQPEDSTEPVPVPYSRLSTHRERIDEDDVEQPPDQAF